jgi:CRP-like cAMP-binding protein
MESVPFATLEALQRIKLFAGLGADQLECFARYLLPIKVAQFGNLVRKGQDGDAMYVVVDGELRALTIIEGKESILATMGPGDCFGEISLLDQGPRSADVVANQDSTLLKLSKAAFERLVREAPALAMPFVLELSRVAVQRVRHATKRYEDSIQFIRTCLRLQAAKGMQDVAHNQRSSFVIAPVRKKTVARELIDAASVLLNRLLALGNPATGQGRHLVPSHQPARGVADVGGRCV